MQKAEAHQRSEVGQTGEDGTIEKEEIAENPDFHKGVMILPIQLTKGLEFDAVILWNPDEQAYKEQEGDAKLLYVAVTRALHELHIVYKETLSGLF